MAIVTENLVGKTLVCAETGKTFIGAYDGCTTNYAYDNDGRIYSDEGVNIRELREISERKGPISAYLSGDGKNITGWKGNKLMRVTSAGRTGGGFGGTQWHIRAIDNEGREWYGRNGGKGMYIKLKPTKN